MGYYAIRTNDQSTIGEILAGRQKISIDRLPWYKDDIKIDDIFFIVISGDKSKKNHDYRNGLKGIYKSVTEPYGWDGKNYKIDLEQVEVFDNVLSKKDFYFYPDTLDATHISPDIKGTATQAIAQFNNKTGQSVIKAIIDLVEKLENRDYLLSFLAQDYHLNKLHQQNDYRIKNRETINKKFNIDDFIEDVSNSKLILDEFLLFWFIAGICTKNFMILTGLSGSGKTKLAQTFCKWITTEEVSLSKEDIFKKGTVIKSDRVEYRVINSDRYSVLFEQADTGTRVTLSFEIIEEWAQTILANKYSEDKSARTIREKVKEKTSYSPQEHSYETHLKASAFYLINKTGQTKIFNQFSIIPVGADWTNREPLLGYPDGINKGEYVLPESGVLQLILNAQQDPEHPYFLILDEMNLSHVERYFADFLSAIESREEIKLHSGNTDWESDGYQIPSSIKVPKNLFIIGTVNIDETTYMFSPKVLDRANVIEFRVNKSEMKTFLSNPADIDLTKLEGKGADMAEDFVKLATSPANEYSDKGKLSEELLKFFSELSGVGAEFGYRTAFEINRFASLAEQLAEDWKFEQIMDASIAQKLLPKLHGSRRKLEKVLFKLGDLCHMEKEKGCEELFKEHTKITQEVIEKAKYPISFEKIVRMHKGLIENGFTSFAEA